MKIKAFLLVILTLYLSVASGQTFINETFSSGQMPPSGWTIDQFSSQWTVSQSAFAGGVSPEGRFEYSTNGTPITTRLISPEIDLTGLTSVTLTFNHFFDWFANPGPSLGVATRSGATGDWQTVWSITPIFNIGPIKYSLTINNNDVGSSQFQFCFFLSGPMSMMDYWYVDNIVLLNPYAVNAQLQTISQTASTFFAPSEVKGTIINQGLNTITTAEVNWQMDGGDIHSTSFPGLSLNTFDTYEFTCNDLMNAPIGTHNLKVWINSVNGIPDMDQGDDTLSKTVKKVCYAVRRIPMFEEFTSCTCIPCAFFNSDFVPWCNSHEEDITLIKYQMNWPGVGDPYYTEEGGFRRDFYGVTWVPWLVGDGGFLNTEMNDVNAFYDADSAQVSLIKIQASHSLSDHVMTINTTVLPFANFPACHLYIAVIEKVTHNNSGSNGETSFEHVMMKMVPTASGVAVNLQERIPFSYSKTVDLSGTHIEEWNDLMVVAWVQNDFTKKIFQSAYSIEDGSFGTENRLSDILVGDSSLIGFNPDSYEYYYGIPGGSAVVPETTGIPVDSTEIVIVIPALTIPGTTTLDVYAENIQYHTQYKVNFLVNTGLNDIKTEPLSVYPNPSSDHISIYGAENARISITDAVGRQYRLYNDFSGNRIDFSGMPAGIYFLKAEKPGHSPIVQKVIITEK